jgi:hypothetical protein
MIFFMVLLRFDLLSVSALAARTGVRCPRSAQALRREVLFIGVPLRANTERPGLDA